MTAETRYYVVTNGDNPERLVDAITKAQAERHVASPICARIAKQKDISRLLQAGVKIEKAGEQAEPQA